MKCFLWVGCMLAFLSAPGQKITVPESAPMDWGSFSGDSGRNNAGNFLDAQSPFRTGPSAWVSSQMPFGFASLKYFDAGVISQFKNDFIGLRLRHFGNVFLQTQQVRVMLSKSLGNISISAAITLDRLKEVEKKSPHSIGGDIGFLWGESSAFHWGFQIERLVYSNRSFQQPIIKLGGGFKLSNGVYTELRFVAAEKMRAFLELCYRPAFQWQLRFGYRYPDIGYWYALSWNIGHMVVEHQLMYQSLLGFSPGVRFFFNLKSKRQ